MNLVEKEHASTDSGNTRLCFVARGKTFESCMKKKTGLFKAETLTYA